MKAAVQAFLSDTGDIRGSYLLAYHAFQRSKADWPAVCFASHSS
jgi:hypothetical protein